MSEKDPWEEPRFTEEGLTDLETARLSFRWALDKIRVLQEEVARLKGALQEKSSQLRFLEEQGRASVGALGALAPEWESEASREAVVLKGQILAKLEGLGKQEEALEGRRKQLEEIFRLKEALLHEQSQERAQELAKRRAELALELREERQRRAEELQRQAARERSELESERQKGLEEVRRREGELQLLRLEMDNLRKDLKLRSDALSKGEALLEGRRRDLDYLFAKELKTIQNLDGEVEARVQASQSELLKENARLAQELKDVEVSFGQWQGRLEQEFRRRLESDLRSERASAETKLKEREAELAKEYRDREQALERDPEARFRAREVRLEEEFRAREARLEEELRGRQARLEQEFRERLESALQSQRASAEARLREREAELAREHQDREEDLKQARAAREEGLKKVYPKRKGGRPEGSAEVSSYVRSANLKTQKVRVETLLEELLAQLSGRLRARGIALKKVYGQDLKPISLDPRGIQEAMLHLIQNALEAMPAGGELFFEILRDPHERQVVLRIRDSGRGIAEKDWEKVFEPSFTTKPGRQGLGLPKAKQILMDHGGQISLHSEPGKGTTVVCVFPEL